MWFPTHEVQSILLETVLALLCEVSKFLTCETAASLGILGFKCGMQDWLKMGEP